ncbi:SusC/RagA family TonB-linked outer membrane protein [Flavihumibacter sp. R14]|nr:SusC/RagA family TonB-linked outer membrane protein [Flavihumibacter soli]
MKQKLLLSFIVMAISLLPFTSTAQVTAAGTVTDAGTREPLPGVSVKVKGSLTGTATGANGTFSLTNVPQNATLEFSFLGYVSQEARAASNMQISLREDFAKLDEVVITGLATSVKRSNLANSVATISAEELTGTTVNQTLEGALNGKLAGANIVAASGAPGGGISVRLRGLTSVNSSTQPLYVVDGVFMDNSSISSGLNAVTIASRNSGSTSNQDNPSNRIADINPEDIESIEVLKGASAAAIYGSLAASGVIIITTKKGTTGKTKVSFTQDLGMAEASKLLGVRSWDENKIQQFYQTTDAAGNVTNQASVDAEKGRFRDAVSQGHIYNYEEEMYGNNGFLSTTSASVSGGSDKTKFFVSGLHLDEEGIIKNSGYVKSSVRANIDHTISNRFSVSMTTNYINSSTDRGLTNNDNAGVSYGVALSSTPTYVDLHPNANGDYPRNRYGASNPLETRDVFTNNEEVNRFIGGLSLTSYLQQSTQSSTRLILRGGLDYYTLNTQAIFPNTLQFQSDGNGTNGASIQGNTNNLNTNGSAYVVNNYTTADSRFSFTTSAGATLENFDQNQVLNIATILITGQENLDQASAIRVDQFRAPRKNRGLFAQEEINFQDKIILTGGIRLDKSSDNANVNDYEAFPKVSLAVNLGNFDFWKSESINLFKVRAAYGESGNFPPFGAKYTSFSPSNIGGVGGTLIGVTNPAGFTQLGNSNINQERQKEFETGFDLGFLDGKIAFDATYYNRNGEELIFAQNIPSSSGFVQRIVNGGTLRNRGVEIGLVASPFNSTNFKWNSRTNFWLNRSKVTQLDIPPFNIGGFGNSIGTFRIEEGSSATQIVGIDDTNGDGTSDGVFVLGNSEPDFQIGFSNDFTLFKDFNLSFMLHWKSGGQNVNLTEFLTDLGGTSPDYDDIDPATGLNQAAIRLNAGGVTARQYVQDSNYFRLREAGLYYNIPAATLKRAFGSVVEGIKLGVSGTNLFVITPYKSYDPEVSNFGAAGFSTAVEVTPYPAARRLFFHLTANF